MEVWQPATDMTSAEPVHPCCEQKAHAVAKKIASMSRPVVVLAKKSVLSAFNTTLDQGEWQ